MKKVSVIKNRKKVLVVCGDENTQGSYFLNPDSKTSVITEYKYKFATQELQDKYTEELISTDYISEKLTYGAKLKKLLKYDDIVNLGINKGTVKDIVRALRAYSIKFTDLKNQLIIIQTPDLKNDKLFSKIIGKGIEHSTKELLDINGEDDFGFLEKNKDVVNFNKLYKQDVYTEINNLYELYFLQEFLEAKGAHVRIIFEPFSKINLKEYKEWASYLKSVDRYTSNIWCPDSNCSIPIELIINSLNIIDLSDFYTGFERLEKQNKGTLGIEKLKLTSKFLSENGNMLLAKTIQKNIDNKTLEQFVLSNNQLRVL